MSLTLLLALHLLCTHSQPIHICGLITIPSVERSIPNNTYQGLYDEQSISILQGWQLWHSLISQQGGVRVGQNTTKRQVLLTVINSGETTTKTAAMGSLLTKGAYGQCDLIFAPYSSALTLAFAPVIEAAQVPTIAGGAATSYIFQCQQPLPSPCKSINERRFQWLWSVIPSSEYFFEGVLSIFALKGARSVAVWTSNDLFTIALAKGVADGALSNGMLHLGTIVASVVPNATEFVSIVSSLKAFNADIIVSANRKSTSCVPFVQEMKKQNVNPKALALSQCIVDATAREILGDDLRYLVDYSHWDERVKGIDFADVRHFPPTPNKTSGEQFNEAFRDLHGEDSDPLGLACSGFTMGLAVESVLSKVESLDPQEINYKLSLVYETSVFGTLGFNVYGVNVLKEMLNIQTDSNNVIQIITPLASATSQIIYPFPEWHLREFNSKYLAHTSEIIIFVFFVAAVLISVVLFILLKHNWEQRNVRAGQPIFLAFMVVGTIFVYLTVPFWMLHEEVVFCHLRYWFLSIGFTLLFGSLSLKTFKIKNIFVSSLVLKAAKSYTDHQMFIILGALLFIDILICLIWSTVSPAAIVIEEVDPYRLSLNYYKCVYPQSATIIVIIMLIYKALMICFGFYLSVLLWKYGFGNSMFFESRQTIFSMYNVIICVLVGVALEVTLTTTESRETLFVARSICILLSGFVTIMSILAPRLSDPHGKEEEKSDASAKIKMTSLQTTMEHAVELEKLTKKLEAVVNRYKFKHPDSDIETFIDKLN